LPPRFVPEETFPPYSYVTARFPHPTRDPLGHSFGHAALAPPPIRPEQWRESRTYLFACDLFNYGYYWEAHEFWEALWQACGRTGTTAEMLKGLIKLAAAGVKAREGRTAGVARHVKRAVELFRNVGAEIRCAHYLGLDLDWLIRTAQELERRPTTVAAGNSPVEVVFDFQLLPEIVRDGNDAAV
jgi:predicted metal-dependent hydrolase